MPDSVISTVFRSAARFAGQLAFERRYRLETSGIIPLQELGVAGEDRAPYEPAGWFGLRLILPKDQVSDEDVFVDFGSGMGRAVFAAARYPFKRVVGVELSERLNAIARRNIERNRRRLACQHVELVRADALEWQFPDDVTVAFFNNPFRGPTFSAVLDALITSLDRRPRPLRIVYMHPFEHERVMATGRFVPVRRVARSNPLIRHPSCWIRMYAAAPAGVGSTRAGQVQGRAASSGSRSDVRFEAVPDFDHLADEWDRLAERSSSIFATREWHSIWWRHFGLGRTLLTACRRADGTLLALLPLSLSERRAVATLRFLGHGTGDELGPICDPADQPAVALALGHFLRESRPHWDLFLAQRLPGPTDWRSLLGARLIFDTASPTIRTDGMDWEQFLSSRSANFRQQVRRRERRLARDHELQFRLTDDPRRLEADLDTLFRLHNARWGEENSGALRGSRGEFHRKFAARALDRGWLRLWLLHVDGAPVAAWYGFDYGGVTSFYQSGRDPAWEEYSVGSVLLLHTMREAMNDGAREYRLLTGDEAYKYRFANQDIPLQTLGMASGLLGAAALTGAVAARRTPAPVRRALSWVAG